MNKKRQDKISYKDNNSKSLLVNSGVIDYPSRYVIQAYNTRDVEKTLEEFKKVAEQFNLDFYIEFG